MRLLISALIFFTLFFSDARAQTKILAQVNDDIISERDLEQRLAFIRLTGQANITRSVREQILKQLIDEKLKQQEASAAGIEISDEEIQHAARITLQQNGMEYKKVMALLKENNLPASVIEDQIRSDLLFVRAVKKNMGMRAEISDHEVDVKLNEIKEQLDQKQYLFSEILLPVTDPDQDAEVYGRAMQLIMRIRDDGESFEELAKRYSKSPSAAKGGIAGWVPENALSEEEKEEFEVLQPGQLSTPVKTPDGYKILVLHALRDPEEVQKAQETVHLMQLFLPNSFTEKQKKSVLRDLTMTKGSCAQFKSVAEQLNSTPRIDLGKLVLGNLPDQIRSVLNRTALLEPSAPFPIEGGDLILMACSKETNSVLPKKEEIKMQLEGAKLEMLAQRRLKELRRFAVTEIRQ